MNPPLPEIWVDDTGEHTPQGPAGYWYGPHPSAPPEPNATLPYVTERMHDDALASLRAIHQILEAATGFETAAMKHARERARHALEAAATTARCAQGAQTLGAIWVEDAHNIRAQLEGGRWRHADPQGGEAPPDSTPYVPRDDFAPLLGALRDVHHILGRCTIFNAPANRAYLRSRAALQRIETPASR